MARPPKNAEGPSATQRMEMAFWDCLKEMPYSDIVVRDIVERAKVNRNSYYYHYDSMWDLAQASVKHARFVDFARLLMSQKTFNPENPMREFTADTEQGFEMLQILSSENGNQRLLENAKEVITEEWLAMFGCENVLISKRTQSEIDFVFGGITALLASPHISTLEGLVSCIANSEILLETIKTMRQIIRACEPEKIQKAVASIHPTHDVQVPENTTDASIENDRVEGADAGAKSDEIEDVESLVERIIEEELKSEHLEEDEMDSDEVSAQEPANEIETQQQTEGNHEAISTQSLEHESEPEVDLASEENVDSVSSDGEAQEDEYVPQYRPEPVAEVETEAVSITEISVEEGSETTRIEEIILEEAAMLQVNAGSGIGSPPEAVGQDDASAVATAPENDDDEPQLSLDFLF